MYVEKELNDFGKYLVQQSRSNLTRKKKNASKELYNSISYEVVQHKNSFTFSFSMEDYGEFVNYGVEGVGGAGWKKKNVDNNKFKYRNKRPPAKVFNGWVIRRGIAPRDKSGKFASRKSIMFAIANSVYHTGLETTNFFTLPFERAFAKLPDEVIEAYGLDMDKLLKNALKNG